MNRIDRLTAIIIFLQGRKYVPIEELAERYGISERTAYRDLKALEEAGIPLGIETGKGYYILRGYHLPPVMFSKSEAMALLAAERLMQKWNNSELGKSYHSALDKIRSTLRAEDKDFFETMDNHVANLYPEANNSDFSDSDIFSFLQQAIFKNELIEIDYKRPYGEEVLCRKIEPLGLLVRGRNWYLAGWCRLRDDYRMFRLDRFEAYKTTEEKLAQPPVHTLKEFHDRTLHREHELKEVTVWFSTRIARYMGDGKFLHGWAWEKIVEDGVEMTFLTPSIHYTARWILTWGKEVKILRSDEMKQVLREISEELFEHYSELEKEF
ncbi:MAG: YafY family transcriptional regulator [Balneola sp.]|nr:MAG: YafY family transcriptional regulator [Balneola sp.]